MLSEQIKILRQNSGISQVELASALKVTKQSVSNWENDNIMPSIEMLVKIANFFSVSTDFLLGLSSEHYLKTDGLSKKQIAHIQALISDLQKAHN
ncbi:MAG: helix-turn-helix transcriptional regulator [Treponema sp.]|uniref:helix-turn-helix domain-containing protein n=1 Tax=Treponema sp. TaxID=166 RepID=UPI00298D80A7|nr:helix-turn-helix transcriptional regulator [Treponema sp.]MBR5933365.1 helix-turn-helix transcriptional regulator [Treponema sp.]